LSKTRLEAFSDGVIAILITIMVLELKLPQGTDWESASRDGIDRSAAYVPELCIPGDLLEYHHHMLHATQKVNGKVLWANLHLLFWLSLVPFGTAWMGESASRAVPTALYGIISALLRNGIHHFAGRDHRREWTRSTLAKSDRVPISKGRFRSWGYASAIGLAFYDSEDERNALRHSPRLHGSCPILELKSGSTTDSLTQNPNRLTPKPITQS